MHTQKQEQISALEKSSGFKSEEELNVIIQINEIQETAFKIAIEKNEYLSNLYHEKTKLEQDLTKLQQELTKLEQELQEGVASPNFIPVKELEKIRNDIIKKQCAIQKAQAIRRKINQTKSSSGFLAENELQRAEYALQQIKVW